MTESTQKPKDPKAKSGRPSRLLTTAEAAAYLHVSEWSIRKFVAEGKLLVVLIGRGYLFDRVDLDQFVGQHKKKLSAQVDSGGMRPKKRA